MSDKLKTVDGILANAVDYQTGKVDAYDLNKTDLGKLEAALVETGYTLKKILN